MTVSKEQTLQQILSAANPHQLADALRAVDLGLKFSVIKVVFAGLTSAAAQNITTAAAKAAATVTGVTLDSGQLLPAIAQVVTCRVVTGTATGDRSITDAGGTATTAKALLSDDGKTLTFEAVITAFTLTYIPRSVMVPSALFGTQGGV